MEPMPRLGERGVGVQPRSLELHHLLGTISHVLGSGKLSSCIRAHDLLDTQKPPVITTVPFIEPQFHTPYTNLVMLGQNYHEKIFRISFFVTVDL